MKRLLLLAVVVILLLFLALWMFRTQTTPSNNNTNNEVKNSTVTPKESIISPVRKESIPSNTINSIPTNGAGYPPWQGGRAMNLNDPRWKIRNERDKTDPEWQGKMQIDFFGKVVNQSGEPIENVTVKFVRTDLSSKGTSESETKSDANGLFSLHGVLGKRLMVEVEKEGYEVLRSMNRYGFEYASFGDDKYHEAYAQNPVLFYLRKKGLAEPLIYQEQEVNVKTGMPVNVKISEATSLQFTLVTNDSSSKGTWEAQMSLVNGGVRIALDEILSQAPPNSYLSTIKLSNETPKPPTWQLYQGGSFYLQSGQDYGRLDVQMVLGNDWVRFKSWINPKTGSRNIEDNPDKHISPNRIREIGLEKAIEEAKNK